MALEIFQKAKGHEHPNIGTIINNLGFFAQHSGEYDKSIDYHKKALKIFDFDTIDKDIEIIDSKESISCSVIYFLSASEISPVLSFTVTVVSWRKTSTSSRKSLY